MWVIFNYKFYSLVVQNIISDIKKDPKCQYCVLSTFVVVPVICICLLCAFDLPLLKAMGSIGLLLIAIAYYHFFRIPFGKAEAEIKGVPYVDKDAPKPPRKIVREPLVHEDGMTWYERWTEVTQFQHWSSHQSDTQNSADDEALQRLRQNNDGLLHNELLRQNNERLRQTNERLRQDNERLRQDNEQLQQYNEMLHSHPSSDSADVETYSIDVETYSIDIEEESDVESNLLQQATHRSRHPSKSSEEQSISSSFFITEAEVYRPNSEESE